MNADVTIFDYAALKANTDYEFPFRRNSGIEYVIVNGETAVEGGRFNGTLNGGIVRKAN